MLYVRLVAVAFNLAIATVAARAGSPLLALLFALIAVAFVALTLTKL
jgi:hypothetical protein